MSVFLTHQPCNLPLLTCQSPPLPLLPFTPSPPSSHTSLPLLSLLTEPPAHPTDPSHHTPAHTCLTYSEDEMDGREYTVNVGECAPATTFVYPCVKPTPFLDLYAFRGVVVILIKVQSSRNGVKSLSFLLLHPLKGIRRP